MSDALYNTFQESCSKMKENASVKAVFISIENGMRYLRSKQIFDNTDIVLIGHTQNFIQKVKAKMPNPASQKYIWLESLEEELEQFLN